MSDFAFRAGSTNVSLRTDRSLPVGRQGEFLADSGSTKRAATDGRTTALFSLTDPQVSTPAHSAFYLTYTAKSGPLTLHLFERRPGTSVRTEVTATLPEPGVAAVPKAPSTPPSTARIDPLADAAHPASPSLSQMRYLLPVDNGAEVVAFKVTAAASDATMHILGAGLTSNYPGVSFSENLTSVRSGIRLTQSRSSNGEKTTEISFPALVRGFGNDQAQLVLTYTYTPGKGIIHLVARGSDRTDLRRYIVEPRAGVHRLYLYTASCGFTPSVVQLTTSNVGFRLDSLTIHRFSTPKVTAGSGGTTTPIPADFGAILTYSPKWWRQSDYELFSWSLVPSVIVMEFSSYAVQAEFMKRFAFFIEKQGFAGRLRTHKQLAGLHGWNAHDYRPADLARFYTTAAKEGYALDPQEQHLKEILLANGLIRGGDGEYTAGRGAILTFAHVGPLWLRWILLTHEGYHGIFFTHPSYRQSVFSIWRHTPAGEQSVFRDVFMRYFRYDTTDKYLVENEFQAYLMQQSLNAVQGYFKEMLAQEMEVMRIPATSPYARYAASHPQMFRDSATKIQKAVEQAVGVSAGDLVGLQPQ